MSTVKANPLGDRPKCFTNTTQEVLFVLVATMAVGMGSLTSGAVTVLSAFVGRDLNMTTVEITWISASSGLSGGAFLLCFARLADLFGRKEIFCISSAIFTVFCIAAGFANSGITLDILNGFIGLASAAAVPSILGIMGASYEKPSRRKNYVFAIFGSGNPLGFIFGAIIAGIATQYASWRATYWVLGVMYAIVTAISFFTVPGDDSQKSPLTFETLKTFDIVGTILTVAGVGLLSAGLGLGSDAPHGYATPYVIVFLILGVIFIGAFIWWEYRVEYPLIPMHIWKDRDFSLLMLILALGFMAFPLGLLWITIYMEDVLSFTPLSVAAHLLPAAISGIGMNILGGMILHVVSNKTIMYAGNICYVISFVLFAINKAGISYWPLILPGLALTVAGCDLGYLICNMYVMLSMPASQQSIAGSLLQMVTKLGVTLSFGISTAIFNNVQAKPSKKGYYANNAGEPYSMVFWYCCGCCVLCVALCPFLTINTQGNAVADEQNDDDEEVGVNRKAEAGIVEPSGLGEKMSPSELTQSQQIPDGKKVADVVMEMQTHSGKDKVL